MGIKGKQKISKPCTNCFAPQYIKFNFSYISYDDNFEDKYKIQLFNRMRQLSSQPYITVLNWDKKIGLEFEEIQINKKVPQNFSDRFQSKEYNNKFAIMRLYTNNNPILGRIIGVIIKNVYYIFFIDIGGNLYKH
ncbi:MAG: hypothetical protein J6D03_09055 [Clostridia bacterium]|nr:hypothetical protein [Clostridia bacterium]